MPSTLGVRQWLHWGAPINEPELGNVLMFWRVSRNGWNGHIGLYVGEDSKTSHVLGRNTANEVGIARIGRERFLGARDCPWHVSKPANVRRIVPVAGGARSSDEG